MDSHLEKRRQDWYRQPEAWRFGTEVTGTLSDPSGQVWEIRNGNLQGNQLTFDVTAREHGGTKNIHFFGQVEEGALTLQNESRGRPGQTMTF
jgi:hypothetical protein